jgi:hypothetical protein
VTIAGTFGGSDTESGDWPDSTSTGEDSEIDQTTDQDKATITETQTGTIDSSGNETPTASSINVNGDDKSNETDTISAAEYVDPSSGTTDDASDPPDEMEVETDGSTETDRYDIATVEQSGNMVSMSDVEKLADQINDTIQITPTASGAPISGVSQLGGAINADIKQTGDSSSGGFELNPDSDDDTVELTGSTHNKMVLTSTQPEIAQSPNSYYVADNGAIYQYLYDMSYPFDESPPYETTTNVTTTVQYDDTGLQIDEADEDVDGSSVIESMDYEDAPAAKITIVKTTPGITERQVTEQEQTESVEGVDDAEVKAAGLSATTDSVTADITGYSGQQIDVDNHYFTEQKQSVTGHERSTDDLDVMEVSSNETTSNVNETVLYSGDALPFYGPAGLNGGVIGTTSVDLVRESSYSAAGDSTVVDLNDEEYDLGGEESVKSSLLLSSTTTNSASPYSPSGLPLPLPGGVNTYVLTSTLGNPAHGGGEEYSNQVPVPDLQATILHCLGIDHERLTYKAQGLDFRLTGVEKATVVKGIFS